MINYKTELKKLLNRITRFRTARIIACG